MNKTKYPNISWIKIQKSVHAVTVTNSVEVFLVLLYTQAFKMASCVSFCFITKLFFLDFCLEYKHINGMTFSPDLLKNGTTKK